MNVQLRVRLPALERLRADSAVDWVQLHRGDVLAHGRDTLAALGLRHPQAAVRACLDPNDLILLELQLPPLSGRRLQSALQGEVEAMLLDDLQEVALAHGAQAADVLALAGAVRADVEKRFGVDLEREPVVLD